LIGERGGGNDFILSGRLDLRMLLISRQSNGNCVAVQQYNAIYAAMQQANDL